MSNKWLSLSLTNLYFDIPNSEFEKFTKKKRMITLRADLRHLPLYVTSNVFGL